MASNSFTKGYRFDQRESSLIRDLLAKPSPATGLAHKSRLATPQDIASMYKKAQKRDA